MVSIAITSTFTAEPIEQPLQFWLRELGEKPEIQFAPYGQVFQQLLDPNSEIRQNTTGINLLLMRFEDWARYQKGALTEELVSRNVDELASALQALARQSSTPTLIWIGPPSKKISRNGRLATMLAEQKERLRKAIQGLESMHWLESEEESLYRVESREDEERDRLGHIPFTPSYYAALATVAARRIHAIRTSPYKVLVLDCDNTLWQGVVGEDGPQGVQLPPGKRAVQEFALAQQREGMVLCLVSKNVEADVFAVFEERPEMPLRREHLVAWRINWQGKAQNLVELAAELELGLDSFVFLDDNPIECAEVRAALPQVLTLQLPQEDAAIPSFLRHLWAFDRIRQTEEDRQRTVMYQQNSERKRFERQVSNVAEFLAGLQIQITIANPADNQWERISQLTQRTNQFNLTTIRRTSAELQALRREGHECWAVSVCDRFGDYGLVGVMVHEAHADTLRVDTFLLSCRVLGRGVEHEMLAYLGREAQRRGLAWVEASFVPTAKNQPAANFLSVVGVSYQQEGEGPIRYRFPAAAAAQVKYQPAAPAISPSETKAPTEKAAAEVKGGRNKSDIYMRIASLQDMTGIERAITASSLTVRPELGTAFVDPEGPLERELAELWSKVLHLDRVGRHDDFEQLGGTSLRAAHLFAEIHARFGLRLPMTTILDAHTVAQLAQRIEGGERQSLRLLRPGSSGGLALFLVHDGDGETLLYRNLAHHLPAEMAVYGIEPHGTDQCPILHTRLADMAAHYIQQIRSVMPEGPYCLAGMCAGGVLAFEMGLQLEAQGRTVGLVGVLDAAAPWALRRQGLINERRRQRFLDALNEGLQGSVLQRLLHKTRIGLGKAARLIRYEVSARTLGLYEKTRFRLFRSLRDRNLRIPRLFHGLSVRRIYELAEREYRPTAQLKAPLILFRAAQGAGNDEPFIHLFEDPLFGWERGANGRLEVIDVPGGHSSMLQEPHVGTLAEHLGSACMEAICSSLATAR